MKSWISKTPRRKNEVFICPYCNGEVRFTDGKAREKGSDSVSVCRYRYCGWCGKGVKSE